ncbi:MAG TPA: SMI1/KNR4 family protein [Longimicrobium sp.]|jgi:hypothetical protein
MDASALIVEWKRRLVAMAESPPYVFRDTPPELIDAHRRRVTTFAGFAEEEVADAEARLGVCFPAVFRAWLREMARRPGELFRGSDLAGVADFERFRAGALEMLADLDPPPSLPPDAVVFLAHQGYTFLYLLAAGGFDGPVMQWMEGRAEPEQVAATFAAMVDAELRLMERGHAAFREQGGYHLTLHADGGSTTTYPALASGDRPLERVAPAKRWWQFWRS